jgi:hypothetical protein
MTIAHFKYWLWLGPIFESGPISIANGRPGAAESEWCSRRRSERRGSARGSSRGALKVTYWGMTRFVRDERDTGDAGEAAAMAGPPPNRCASGCGAATTGWPVCTVEARRWTAGTLDQSLGQE